MGSYDSEPRASAAKAPTTAGTLGEQVLPKAGASLHGELGGARSAKTFKEKEADRLIARIQGVIDATVGVSSTIDKSLADVSKGGDAYRALAVITASIEKIPPLVAGLDNIENRIGEAEANAAAVPVVKRLRSVGAAMTKDIERASSEFASRNVKDEQAFQTWQSARRVVYAAAERILGTIDK